MAKKNKKSKNKSSKKNVEEKTTKKRKKRNMPSGENHPNASVNDEQVAKIRRKYGTGKYTQAELAEKYGLSLQYTNRLINGRVRP